MTRRTTIVYRLSLLLGIGTVVAFWICSRLADPNGSVRLVLIAKKNLGQGDPINKPEECFELVPAFRGESGMTIPQKFVKMIGGGKYTKAPNAALTSWNQIRGKVINRSIRGSEYITRDDIVEDSSISASLPVGTRYVGLRINATELEVNGLTHQKVDIYRRTRRGSQLCVEQAYVVAVDRRIRVNDRLSKENATLVTLGMSEQNVAEMEHAKELGVLLLKIGDQEIGTPRMTPNDEFGSPYVFRQSMPGNSGEPSMR